MAMLRYRTAIAALAVASTAMVAMGGSAGASVSASHSVKASTPTKLYFNSKGIPNLRGTTISIANSAGSAHIGDAHIYAMQQFLQSWGATVSLTKGSGNLMEEAVAGGSQDLCTSPVANALDAGLTAFGPNQTSVAYSLLVPTSITSLSQLAGKKYADDYSSGNVDFPLWNAVAKLGKFSMSSMTLVTTGAETSSFNQVISGNVSAAWVDPNTVASAGPNFHALTTGAKVAPTYADSMMFALPSWIKANPATAEAVDLAWIASAKQFTLYRGAWAKNAYNYTLTNSYATINAAYSVLKASGGFGVRESSFSRIAMAQNFAISKALGIITTLGNRPLSQLLVESPWINAWNQYSAHKNSYQ
jgi:ABC-type nitrate/sulfonate/bicarbonate transport system substrate-binding protein